MSCDFLARDGYSANSHVVRFSYPLLPAVYQNERGLIGRIRSLRNAAQYDARDSVPRQIAAQAIQLARRALAEVRTSL
jgi:hypothetical protein